MNSSRAPPYHCSPTTFPPPTPSTGGERSPYSVVGQFAPRAKMQIRLHRQSLRTTTARSTPPHPLVPPAAPLCTCRSCPPHPSVSSPCACLCCAQSKVATRVHRDAPGRSLSSLTSPPPRPSRARARRLLHAQGAAATGCRLHLSSLLRSSIRLTRTRFTAPGARFARPKPDSPLWSSIHRAGCRRHREGCGLLSTRPPLWTSVAATPLLRFVARGQEGKSSTPPLDPLGRCQRFRFEQSTGEI
jgi:hypothetical protein